MRYSHQWTAGLSGEEKAIMSGMLENNNKVLDRLAEMCYNMLRESEKTSNDYDNPNWALKAADGVGYRRALERVARLCTQTPDKGTT